MLPATLATACCGVWCFATVLTVPLGIVTHRAIKSFGRRMLTGKYLRGAVKVSDEELARQVRKKRQATRLRIGKVPLPAGSECEHLAFIGGPGTGKTQAILGLLDADPCARRRGRHLRQQGHLHEPLLRRRSVATCC